MEINVMLKEIYNVINIIKKYEILDVNYYNIDMSNNTFEDMNNIITINLVIKDALILSDKYFNKIIYKENKNINKIYKKKFINKYHNILDKSLVCLTLPKQMINMLDYINAQFETFDTLIHMMNQTDIITVLSYLYNIVIYFKNIIQSTFVIFLDNIIKISVLFDTISFMIKTNNNINIQLIELGKLNIIVNNCNNIVNLIHMIQKNIEDKMILLCDVNIDDFDTIFLGIINNNDILLLEKYIKNIDYIINI